MSPPAEGTRQSLSGVETLTRDHDTSRFDCGKHALNDWLKRFALMNQASDAARTYVVHRGGEVAGFFSIAAGSVARDEAPGRIAKGLAQHAIPVILLARLAVDAGERGTGLGKALLKEALLRIEAAADIVGARAVLVHAIDDEAQSFYEHFGFEPSPVDDLQMMLLMKDLRASLRR